jgi:hypothetical protein
MRAKPVKLIFFLLVIVAIGGGAAYFFTRSPEEQRQMLESGEKAALEAKIEAEKVFLATQKKLLAELAEAKKSGVSQENYKGYDASAYDKEADYQKAVEESEKRLNDLQARLNKVYDK